MWTTRGDNSLSCWAGGWSSHCVAPCSQTWSDSNGDCGESFIHMSPRQMTAGADYCSGQCSVGQGARLPLAGRGDADPPVRPRISFGVSGDAERLASHHKFNDSSGWVRRGTDSPRRDGREPGRYSCDWGWAAASGRYRTGDVDRPG